MSGVEEEDTVKGVAMWKKTVCGEEEESCRVLRWVNVDGTNNPHD